MKKAFLLFILVFSIFSNVFADSEVFANRNVALRYLKLSQDYLIKSQWNNVISYAEIGLNYDSSLADLWYVRAVALSQKNEATYILIEYLEKALENEWVSYNPSGAKLLLANCYYKTMEYEKALVLLEDRALTLNSDALKLRGKIFYITQNIDKARETINTGYRMFPSDVDFPLIFYQFENLSNLENEKAKISNEMFVELNKTFLSLIFEYVDSKNFINQDLLLLASTFADKELQTKILKVYKSQGIKNPLYSIKAWETGFISVEEAVSSYFKLSNGQIDFNLLQELIDGISEENKNLIFSVLDNFEGIINFDFNKDGFYELITEYKNGRPNNAVYEQKQDGILTWSATFDYGTPRKIYIPSKELTLIYARYPYVSEVKTENLDFYLIPDTFSWLPLNVELASFSKDVCDFYIVYPDSTDFDSSLIYKNSSSVVTFLSNKNQIGEDKIRFLLSDGEIVSGNYYLDNNLYAASVFENGKLIFRNVDKDLNGSFDATEIFSEVENPSDDYVENFNFEDVFGTFPYSKKLWLSSVTIDLNEDSVADYFENYNQDGSKTKKWDSIQETRNSENNLVSVIFENPQNKRLIQVNFEAERPISFFYNNGVYPVKYDSEKDFYWIGDIPDYEENLDYKKIKTDLLNKKTDYSVVIYSIDENNSFYVVKSYDFYFAQQM